ncbi:MAG: CoB--CoM heterodisulfide reductase iron-sulfur subunit A family protein [Candidatus Aminicenantes bacterium]|nr:CoB--CoM heterodisulfide reductase iron-sulfur subunit A family protein [Candidatus Aminicenantes bacterium]
MEQKGLTGIYFCDDFNGKSDAIDTAELMAYAENNPDAAVTWSPSRLPITDPEAIAAKIKEFKLERMVIAGDMPGMVKPVFARAMAAAGNDPGDIILAGFREYGAVSGADTDRAKGVIACALKGVTFGMAAVPEETDVNQDTVIIGAGIAGIQAALEIADSGRKVYLIEKTGTIGGHMAMFDKTFPTLDCAACILTPKMVEIGQHPNIELMSYCEVSGVSGKPGNFKVKILKKARRVNLSTCIGCGNCAEKCPGRAPSEFDAGISTRRAIYIPFPQAVPNKYLIDADSCLYVKNGKCGVCVKNCPVENCINLDEKDETVEVTAGNIIVATGFQVFDAKKVERFGYGQHANVLTSLEFERVVNAAGPTAGEIYLRTLDKKGNYVFPKVGTAPESVALIHCVGSRDENYHKYCSRVCCMYSLKLAHLIKEKLPSAKVSEYYIDMRAFGKGYEEFYERIKSEGVNIIQGRTAKVEGNNGKLLLRSEDMIEDKLIEEEVDMVILAVGLEPRQDAAEIAKMLGISQTEEGWFREADSKFDPVNTFSGGITIAGVCQGPKDIPDTVAQGSAAAARALQSQIKGKIRGNIKDIPLQKIEARAKELSTLEEAKK